MRRKSEQAIDIGWRAGLEDICKRHARSDLVVDRQPSQPDARVHGVGILHRVVERALLPQGDYDQHHRRFAETGWRGIFSQVTEPGSEPLVDVVVSEVIRRPLDVVADYTSDPSHAPEWYANISEVEWKTEPPVHIGSEAAFVAHFLGRELRYTYVVVEHTPESLVMRTAQEPFPMETSYRYESLPDGATRVTLRNRGTPSGFSRVAAPLMSMAMRRATTKDLRALKRVLEHG